MVKFYKEFLEQEAQSKKDKQDIRKLEIMQRLKENEANCRFYKERYEKNVKDIEETRKNYEKQIVSLCLCVRIFICCILVHRSAD
jgi:archaellum biogenesis protein FlaJ (TadC family)